MKTPEDLAAQMTGKTNDQLADMFKQPDDWLPEALDAARAEMQRRGIAHLDIPTPAINEICNARPTIITVICIIGIIGGFFAVPIIFSDKAAQIGAWYPPLLAFSTLVGFICMIGFWKMRRWAVFTYAALCVFNQILILMMGKWNILTLLVPGILIIVGFMYLSKMK